MSDFQTIWQTAPRIAAFGGAGVNQHFSPSGGKLRFSGEKGENQPETYQIDGGSRFKLFAHPQPAEGIA
jgi:hypothetical protein